MPKHLLSPNVHCNMATMMAVKITPFVDVDLNPYPSHLSNVCMTDIFKFWFGLLIYAYSW